MVLLRARFRSYYRFVRGGKLKEYCLVPSHYVGVFQVTNLYRMYVVLVMCTPAGLVGWDWSAAFVIFVVPSAAHLFLFFLFLYTYLRLS